MVLASCIVSEYNKRTAPTKARFLNLYISKDEFPETFNFSISSSKPFIKTIYAKKECLKRVEKSQNSSYILISKFETKKVILKVSKWLIELKVMKIIYYDI